jgi:hypothetical protein
MCVQNIIVVDNELPVIICDNDISVPTDQGKCNARVQELPPQVSDNCGAHDALGNRSDGASLGDPFPVGTTTITWTVTDIHGNINTCEQKITVTDTEKPAIHCPQPVIVANDQGQCGATVTLAPPEVYDNCGIQSVNGPTTAFYPLGTTTVSFTVTDIHGNVSSCVTTVTVLDKEPPVIICPAEIVHNTDPQVCSYSFIPELPVATDNCSGVVRQSTRSDGEPIFAPYQVGTTEIYWTAIDASGNISTCTQRITIIDD